MGADGVGRRRLIGGVAAATAGGLLSAGVATPVLAEEPGRRVVGAWWNRRRDADGYAAYGVWTFAEGGVTTYRDIYPVNALIMGGWTARGPRITWELWGALRPENVGVEGLTARVAGEGLLGRGSFSSPYVVTLFDGATEQELGRYEGQADCTRLLDG